MPARYIRNTVILAKQETTSGTDIVPVVGSDAILVSNMTITPLDAQNINRALVRGYFGGSEQLVGAASVKCSFDVELAGSATAATAPQWGDLLIGCAFAETTGLTAPNRVEYLPASTSLKSLSIYYFDDGVLHKLLFAMGTWKLSAKVGERPLFTFEFTALDGGVTATAAGATTLTAWKTPVAVVKANVVDVTLGATYSAGALSGGVVYPTTGLTLDAGNTVSFTPLLKTERVDITNREMTGHCDFDLTAAEEVTFMGVLKANTTQSVAITIGTAAGNKIILHAPSVQLINASKVDYNGSRLIGFDLRLVPVVSGSGNDELRIITQ